MLLKAMIFLLRIILAWNHYLGLSSNLEAEQAFDLPWVGLGLQIHQQCLVLISVPAGSLRWPGHLISALS